MINYCIEFFLEDSDEMHHQDRADRRSECLDLSMTFSSLVTSQYTQYVFLHAQTILEFISEYLHVYTIENYSFEVFLTSSLHILFVLDVNNLELSFSYLGMIYGRLLDLINSKSDSLKIVVINLLRFYINLGAQRDDDEVSNVSSFLHKASRIQATLYDTISSMNLMLPLSQISLLLDESRNYENDYNPNSFGLWAYINLNADLAWLELHNLQPVEQSIDSQDVSSQSQDKPRKKSKNKFTQTIQNLHRHIFE